MGTRSRLDDDPSFLLARANALSMQAGNRALAAHGLRVRSYAVLALAAGEDAPAQRALAEQLRLDPSQVVALVDDLESRELVTREPDPADRRTRVVRVTPAGRRVLDAAERELRRAESPVLDQLTPEQREALPGILRVLAFPADS